MLDNITTELIYYKPLLILLDKYFTEQRLSQISRGIFFSINQSVGVNLVSATKMSKYVDEFADIAPIIEDEFSGMSLEDIQSELLHLQELAEAGHNIDEHHFDALLEAQENHPEFRALIEEERENWIESVSEFVENCLERTRSFIPVNVFDSTADDLTALGLSSDLAKRLLQRQCLWLVRMSRDEISRMHESDLLGRFNSLQQNLDIIETAAIYASLPDEYINDPRGLKKEYKKSVEDNLRQMLMENDNDELPDIKIRNPSYEGRQYGPIKDVTSVRELEVTKGDGIYTPKKSFLDLCPSNHTMIRMTRSMRRSNSGFNSMNSMSIDRTVSRDPSVPLLTRMSTSKRGLSREGSILNMNSTSNVAINVTAPTAPLSSHSQSPTNKNVNWKTVSSDGTPSTVVEIDEVGGFEDD